MVTHDAEAAAIAGRQLRLEHGKLHEKRRHARVQPAFAVREATDRSDESMFKFLPYVLKTLWRHRSRTILTVSGSAVALFVFCFVGSVQQGMNDLAEPAGGEAVADRVSGEQILPGDEPFAAGLRIEDQAKLAGVREVVPIQVFTNNCRASLDVIVFYGVPPEKLRTARDFRARVGQLGRFRAASGCGRRRPGRREPARTEGGRQVLDRRSHGAGGGRVHVERSGRRELHLLAPRFSAARQATKTWSARSRSTKCCSSRASTRRRSREEIDALFRGGPVRDRHAAQGRVSGEEPGRPDAADRPGALPGLRLRRAWCSRWWRRRR